MRSTIWAGENREETMSQLRSFIRGFLEDETGASAVEYGLLVALISLAGILALVAIGVDLTAILGSISTVIQQGASTAQAGAAAATF